MVDIGSRTASELGYLNVPENTLIEIDQLKNYPPEKTVLITTGSQGESMAAISRDGGGCTSKSNHPAKQYDRSAPIRSGK